ncbi:MAG TPA: isoprenylcysteine carboxylmethyltransferase family protein [Jiangellales bacterium]|nr:isoprenylcysteine carboxylmethyltransferase family protein [Jiangellales bacterium]
MRLASLVGSGDKIALLMSPFVVVGVLLNVMFPAAFDVGGPPKALQLVSMLVLAAGVAVWLWTVVLILREVPRGELITAGPYAVVKHPLYTGVALLVLPWAGFLLDTWLGALLGAVLYVASRLFAGEEEAELASTFGDRWCRYATAVKVPWL